MIKKALSFLLAVLITTLFCGCLGYRETNEGLTVSLIGLDRKGEDIKMTVQTVLPDTEGKVECKTVSVTAENIEKAYKKLGEKTVKPLIFEHCVGAALGTTLRKNDILDFLEFAERKSNINLSLNFFYTTDAMSFIMESGNLRQGGFDVIELIKNNSKTFENKLFMIKRELHKGSIARVPFVIFKGEEAVIEKTVIVEGSELFEN